MKSWATPSNPALPGQQVPGESGTGEDLGECSLWSPSLGIARFVRRHCLEDTLDREEKKARKLVVAPTPATHAILIGFKAGETAYRTCRG